MSKTTLFSHVSEGGDITISNYHGDGIQFWIEGAPSPLAFYFSNRGWKEFLTGLSNALADEEAWQWESEGMKDEVIIRASLGDNLDLILAARTKNSGVGRQALLAQDFIQ